MQKNSLYPKSVKRLWISWLKIIFKDIDMKFFLFFDVWYFLTTVVFQGSRTHKKRSEKVFVGHHVVFSARWLNATKRNRQRFLSIIRLTRLRGYQLHKTNQGPRWKLPTYDGIFKNHVENLFSCIGDLNSQSCQKLQIILRRLFIIESNELKNASFISSIKFFNNGFPMENFVKMVFVMWFLTFGKQKLFEICT